MRKVWEKKEIDLLEEYFTKGKNISDLCLILNRSRTSVHHKASRLGISYIDNPFEEDVDETWVGLVHNYEISDKGRIKNIKTKSLLKPYIDTQGYSLVEIKNKNYWLHIEVAKKFLPWYEGCQVNHIDENKQNNELSNLDIVTCQENILHSVKSRRSDSKWRFLDGKIPDEIKLEIFELSEKFTRKQLSVKFDIHIRHIYTIISQERQKRSETIETT